MGYSEELCQICGVSFNIRRVRSRDEPRSAAFGGHPGYWVSCTGLYYDEEQERTDNKENSEDGDDDDDGGEMRDESPEDDDWRCREDSGCLVIYRKEELAAIAVRSGYMADSPWPEEDDPEHDPGYVGDSEVEGGENEPLEYDSETEERSEDFEGKDEIGDGEGSDCIESDTRAGWAFQANPSPPQYDTEFMPISMRLDSPLRTPDGAPYVNHLLRLNEQYHEHIAGPGCRNTEGYRAHNISVEEMRNCHTVQCILRKPSGWRPAADDMDFEKEGDYFLTGLADRMPTSLWDMEIEPARHGVGDGLRSQSAFYIETTQEELDALGLPCHPTCFELFIQASKQTLGKVDIDALARIRDRAVLQGKEFPVAHNDDVLNEQDQVWNHTPGLEYLVANPVFIPDLAAILAAAISTDEGFSVQNSPFPQRQQNVLAPTSVHDPFLLLPAELIYSVAWELDSQDIAALRLSSRAFTHLPISLWHHLTVTEMPYLYEAWSPDPAPYYWSTLLATDLLSAKRTREKFHRDLQDRIETIREDMPDIAEQWIEDNSKWEWPEDPDKAEMLQLAPVKLPFARTNWYQLYRDLVGNKNRLQGLRNRERIWAAVLQIIDAIRHFREEMMRE